MNVDYRKGSKGCADKKVLPPHLRPKFSKATKAGKKSREKSNNEETAKENDDGDEDREKEGKVDKRDRKSGEREEEEAECRDDDDDDQLMSKERASKEKEDLEEEKAQKRKSKEDETRARRESPSPSKKAARKKKTSVDTTTEGSRRVAKADKWMRKKKMRNKGSGRSVRSKKGRKTTPTRPSTPSNSSGSAEGKKGKKRNSNETAKKDLERKGFFKKIIDKTKFWRKLSDCVAQPTPEMLIKPCVAPEYDPSNQRDFSPDPRCLFPNEEDWKLRMKNNRAGPDEVFVQRRPFWMRTSEDVVPKMGQLSISAEQIATPPSTPQKSTRRRQFFDPKTDAVERMMENETLEQLLVRVKANTIQGTIAMHHVKKDNFYPVRQKGESTINPVRFREKPEQINIYVRKHRPKPGHTRQFLLVDYSARPTKKARKKRNSKERNSK